MKYFLWCVLGCAAVVWAEPVDKSPRGGIDDAVVAPKNPSARPFGEPADSSTKGKDPQPILDRLVVGRWWEGAEPLPEGRRQFWTGAMEKFANEKFVQQPRSERIAFALYTTQNRTLKMTAQMLPLLPDESRAVFLDVRRAQQTSKAWKNFPPAGHPEEPRAIHRKAKAASAPSF